MTLLAVFLALAQAEPTSSVQGTQDRWASYGELRVVRSDVPFGTFDVKIRFRDKAGQQVDQAVTVKDGAGSFQSEWLTDGLEVSVDPDEEILARARVAKKVDSP